LDVKPLGCLFPKKSVTPRTAAVISAIALLAGAFFLAPVVPYSVSLNLPGAVSVEPCTTTIQGATTYSGGTATLTLTTTGQATTTTVTCEQVVPYPGAVVNGHAALSYALLGVGYPPFPDHVLITQANETAVVYFQGSKAVAAEDLGPANTAFNPVGVVQVLSAGFSPDDFGFLNFSATIENVGQTSIQNSYVNLQVTGYGFNYTDANGLTWIGAEAVAKCVSSPALQLDPLNTCTVSGLYKLPYDAPLTFYVEVRGQVNGQWFLYRQAFRQTTPAGEIGSGWVKDFVEQVDLARLTSPLTENSTLDNFAELRFSSASSQPQISDYHLANDVASFFPSGNQPVVEVLLYPGYSSPSDYAAYLKGSAPGHWSALTNSALHQFGWYVGYGPYYQVSFGCPVSEIPGAGINITQYFQSQGCTVTPIPEETWLVIVLAP